MYVLSDRSSSVHSKSTVYTDAIVGHRCGDELLMKMERADVLAGAH